MADIATLGQQNVNDNKQILASFGLVDPFASLPTIIQKETPALTYNKAKKRPAVDDSLGSVFVAVRKSARTVTKSDVVITDPLVTKPTGEPQKTPAATVVCQAVNATDASLIVDQVTPSVLVRPTVSLNDSYGPMPEFDVGSMWRTKLDCYYAGIHRTMQSICNGKDGAFSICLSKTPEDDVDLGLCFTYTAPGCRKQKGGKSKKSKKQDLPEASKDAEAPEEPKEKDPVLSLNLTTGNPVRVIRGYRSSSPFAPKSGYRYDGVYTVEKKWVITLLSGDKLWKFALKRCDDQTPPPWQLTSSETEVALDSAAVDGSDGKSSPEAVCLSA